MLAMVIPEMRAPEEQRAAEPLGFASAARLPTSERI